MTTYPNSFQQTYAAPQKSILSTRNVLVVLVLLIALVIGITILTKADLSTLTVSSEEGSTIYVASQPSGVFTDIGTTNASYSTESPGIYYVRVDKGGKSTITAVTLALNESVDISVSLKDVKTPQKIASSAISSPFVTKDFIYGISPSSKSLTYAPLGSKTYTSFFFFGLPFTNKVDWVNKNNFTFVSSKGTGAVVDGSISSLDNPKIKSDKAISNKYLDVTVLNDNSVALVSVDGLYWKKTLKTKGTTKIDSFTIKSGANIFSDDKYIYTAIPNVEFNGGEEGNVPEITSVLFNVYSYKGNKEFSYSLPINSQPTSVIDLEGRFLLTAGENMVLIDKSNGQSSTLDVYFPSTTDAALTNSGIIVFNEAGLWQYDIPSNSFYLLSALPVGEEYVLGSLLVTPNGTTTYFSSQASKANLQQRSGSLVSDVIYKIGL